MKPIGDLHSVPHYRCGRCFGAVVLFKNDAKPKVCKWCGEPIEWKNTKNRKARKKNEISKMDNS